METQLRLIKVKPYFPYIYNGVLCISKKKRRIVKKKKLIYIRIMMAVSLLLLCALISSWLGSQYKEQKMQLQAELQNDLASAKKEVSDSIIYYNVIKPVMNISEVSGSIDGNVSFDAPKGNTKFKIVIGDASDTVHMKEIKEKLAKHKIDLDSNLFRINKTTHTRTKTTYALKDPKASQDILQQGVALVMQEIFQQTGISGDSVFNLDTAHLRKSFIQKLGNKNLHFTTTWNHDISFLPQKQKAIFIETDYLSKNYYVAVNNYAGYIMKKMLPQTLFSLTLLLFVAAAFYISLRSLKEQMRLSTMKNDLISNMSHELKTPISTVKVALEALTTFNGVANPQTTKEYLEMASLEMNRLDMLVNQALNTALLEEGKIVIQKECTDLQKMATDIGQMLQLRTRQNDTELNIHFAGEGFTTKADPLHIQGVIINLLDNSMKYADKKPVIHMTVESKDNAITISVADNGPGIPAEHLKHIFDKFYRVPHGDRHNVKGYGLGLSYSKQVALQHNGDITVKNLQEGGCMFTLSLPKLPC